jgi:hypothetical protein
MCFLKSAQPFSFSKMYPNAEEGIPRLYKKVSSTPTIRCKIVRGISCHQVEVTQTKIKKDKAKKTSVAELMSHPVNVQKSFNFHFLSDAAHNKFKQLHWSNYALLSMSNVIDDCKSHITQDLPPSFNFFSRRRK